MDSEIFFGNILQSNCTVVYCCLWYEEYTQNAALSLLPIKYHVP